MLPVFLLKQLIIARLASLLLFLYHCACSTASAREEISLVRVLAIRVSSPMKKRAAGMK